MIFGRSALEGEDQSLFVYPFYSFLIFAPFAAISDYVTARVAWMTVLELALFFAMIMSISLSRWQISRWLLIAVFLFSALSYHSVRPVILGNASVLCTFFIAASFLAIRSEHDAMAGILLAFAAIKPQIILLLGIFLLIWAASHQRWVLFWSFISTLAILVAISFLLLPGWLLDNLRQIVAYPAYTQPGTPGAIFYQWFPGIGKQMGWTLTVFMAGILFWEWRDAREKEFPHFLWAAYLTLTLSVLIGIRTDVENFIVLYPGLILVLEVWDQRWGIPGRVMVILSMLLLSAGLWWLFLTTLQYGDQPTQNPIMFFPFPIFMLIGLYWARWWAIRPPRLLLDVLRSAPNIDID